jgi:hypothetical protein
MRWYLRPSNLRTAMREGRRIRSGGGPQEVRLARVGEPKGWILPLAELEIEVVARDGTTAQFHPELPVPWPLALGYRAARRFNAPLVRDFDPDQVDLTLRRPGR